MLRTDDGGGRAIMDLHQIKPDEYRKKNSLYVGIGAITNCENRSNQLIMCKWA